MISKATRNRRILNRSRRKRWASSEIRQYEKEMARWVKRYFPNAVEGQLSDEAWASMPTTPAILMGDFTDGFSAHIVSIPVSIANNFPPISSDLHIGMERKGPSC